jgi:uncharacterized protein (DUF4415 family)
MSGKTQDTETIYDADTYLDGAFDPDDDAPDLTHGIWAERMEAAIIQRGRPQLAGRKIQTTLRIDPDVLARFKADGPGWQGRMNAALRRAAGLV